jgi:hypothetical protein
MLLVCHEAQQSRNPSFWMSFDTSIGFQGVSAGHSPGIVGEQANPPFRFLSQLIKYVHTVHTWTHGAKLGNHDCRAPPGREGVERERKSLLR